MFAWLWRKKAEERKSPEAAATLADTPAEAEAPAQARAETAQSEFTETATSVAEAVTEKATEASETAAALAASAKAGAVSAAGVAATAASLAPSSPASTASETLEAASEPEPVAAVEPPAEASPAPAVEIPTQAETSAATATETAVEIKSAGAGGLVAAKRRDLVSALRQAIQQHPPAAGKDAIVITAMKLRPARVVGVKADGLRVLAEHEDAGRTYAYTLRRDGTYRLEGAPDKRAPLLAIADGGSWVSSDFSNPLSAVKLRS